MTMAQTLIFYFEYPPLSEDDVRIIPEETFWNRQWPAGCHYNRVTVGGLGQYSSVSEMDAAVRQINEGRHCTSERPCHALTMMQPPTPTQSFFFIYPPLSEDDIKVIPEEYFWVMKWPSNSEYLWVTVGGLGQYSSVSEMDAAVRQINEGRHCTPERPCHACAPFMPSTPTIENICTSSEDGDIEDGLARSL